MGTGDPNRPVADHSRTATAASALMVMMMIGNSNSARQTLGSWRKPWMTSSTMIEPPFGSSSCTMPTAITALSPRFSPSLEIRSGSDNTHSRP